MRNDHLRFIATTTLFLCLSVMILSSAGCGTPEPETSRKKASSAPPEPTARAKNKDGKSIDIKKPKVVVRKEENASEILKTDTKKTKRSPNGNPTPDVLKGDYLPLISGAEYKFRYEATAKDGRHVKGTVTYKMFTRLFDGVNVFYLSDKKSPRLFNSLVEQGVLLKKGSKIQSIYAPFSLTLKERSLKDAKTFLNLPLKTGNTSTITRNSEGTDKITVTIKITVEDFQTITVPAGTFKNCAKISLDISHANGKTYSPMIWLAPGVGAVKRILTTGRIDELVSYTIPDN